MRKYSLLKSKYIFLFLALVSVLRANSWQGSIISEQGLALRDVYVKNLNSGKVVLSDYSGYFKLEKSTAGDTLLFSHIAYDPVNIVLSDSITWLHISMPLSVIAMNEVLKIGFKDDKLSQDIQATALKTLEMGNVDNSQLMRHLPGLSIKSYGGPAGISTASLDGGPSSHTKILISGFDLTSAQNGQMDISQIPSPLIAGVSLIPVNIARYGSGAIDGVLAFDPWSGANALSFSAGSFGHLSSYGMMSIIGKSWNLDLLGGYRQDEGDYSYTTFLDTLVHTRQNNDFAQYYVSARLSGILKNNTWYRAYYLESHQDRGVAGLTWSTQDILSRRNDHYRILTGKFGHSGDRNTWHTQVLFRDAFDEYNNPYLFIESAFRNRSYDALFEDIYSFDRGELNFILEDKYETLNNSDTLYVRNTILASVSGQYEVLPWLHVSASTHLDYITSYSPIPTGEISLRFPFKARFLSKLSLHAAKLFRYPTFNDLYWVPGGNPDLLPEETYSYSLFATTPISEIFSLDWGVYDKRSKNLIVWMPQASYWTPKNIQEARQNGFKLALNYTIDQWHVSGKLMWNETHSANLSEGSNYGKALRYVPERSGSYVFNWNPGFFSFLFQTVYTGKKIVMYGYPEDTELPATILLNSSLAYRISLGRMDVIPVLAVDNITDLNYETIQGYPEPGRTWRFTLSFEW